MFYQIAQLFHHWYLWVPWVAGVFLLSVIIGVFFAAIGAAIKEKYLECHGKGPQYKDCGRGFYTTAHPRPWTRTLIVRRNTTHPAA